MADAMVVAAPASPYAGGGDAKRQRRDHKLVMSFDVEMTGDYVGKDVMIAFGAAAGYYDREALAPKTVYRALVVQTLNRPRRHKHNDTCHDECRAKECWGAPVMSWEALWRARGYEQQCYDEFWSRQTAMLDWYEQVCERADLVHTEVNVKHMGPNDETSAPMIRISYSRGQLDNGGTDLFVVDNEAAMAFCVDHVLRIMEAHSCGYECVQVADVIDFDAIHVNCLLTRHDYPSTLYTRVRMEERDDGAEDVRVAKRYMGDRYEIDSMIVGMVRANLLAEDFQYSRDVTPYKRWMQQRLAVQNDHRADHDSEHKVALFLLTLYELAPALASKALTLTLTHKDGNPFNESKQNLVWTATATTSDPAHGQ